MATMLRPSTSWLIPVTCKGCYKLMRNIWQKLTIIFIWFYVTNLYFNNTCSCFRTILRVFLTRSPRTLTPAPTATTPLSSTFLGWIVSTSAPDTSSDITMPMLLNYSAFHLQWHLTEKVDKGMIEEEAKQEPADNVNLGMLEHNLTLIHSMVESHWILRDPVTAVLHQHPNQQPGHFHQVHHWGTTLSSSPQMPCSSLSSEVWKNVSKWSQK